VLKALLLFSLITVAADVYLNVIGPLELKEAIIPFTGWVVSSSYSFVAISLVFLMLGYHTDPFYTRKLITFLLFISIIFGIADIGSAFGVEDFGNPYLTVSQWRPVWTIIIPSFWVALLYTPGVSQYCEYLEKKYPKMLSYYR
jgi:hypothetical protein